MTDPVADLLTFIDRSPTPYHAVAESLRRLNAAGYQPLEPTEVWSLSPGDRRTLTRSDGSLIAFQVGSESPVDGGFRLVGAHTDSPNLRLKPRPDLTAQGYRQLSVEAYGALLLHTWLDRDLSIAGRVSLHDAAGPRNLLVDFERPLVRVPNLAIHLNRELDKEGLKLDKAAHSLPILGLEDAPALGALLASELRARALSDVAASDLLAFDLMLYDTQPSAVSGARGEFIQAPRLDNLASCHAAVSALAEGAGRAPAPFTRMVVLYDHEEIGSRSAQGAAGPFLIETLERSVEAFKGGGPQGTARALARWMLISIDMAHSVHPIYAYRHDPRHAPVIGAGPVIKVNAGQAYASDARTAGLFATLCRRVGIEPQHFASRSDLPCGSTIGPISAARAGIPTVDVGNPMLSMHSCREMAGSADVEPMLRVLHAYFEGD